MKAFSFLAALIFVCTFSFAQNKKSEVAEPKKNLCDNLVVDFEKGTVNNLPMNSPIDTIKKYLPCFTEDAVQTADDFFCTGGLLYTKHGFIFNGGKVCFEFSDNFTGKFPLKIMGADEYSIESLLGTPVRITDLAPLGEETKKSVYFYPKNYGCLAVWVRGKDHKVFKVQLQSKPIEKVELCMD